MADQVNLNAASSYKNSPKYSFTSAVSTVDKKKHMPGPGQYDVRGSDKEKFARCPSWTIGGSCKDSGRELGAMPGPGAYSPANPAFTSPKYLFTTDSRLKVREMPLTPGPGQYEVRGKPEGSSPSICSKPESKMRATTPGPGQYKVSYEALSYIESSPKVSFGASNRRDLALNKTPGPGSYEHLTSLGGNCTMRTPAKYSIKGRYNPPQPFITPGPIGAGTTFK